MDFVACQWCQSQSPAGSTSCQACGAQLDQRDKVSDSGWEEVPRLRDMTELKFSNSTCQVEGEVVPVAELALAAGDGVFFEHHVMLWKDPAVPVASRNTGGGLKRMLGGMPHYLTYASGPGRIAFSKDATGELVVLPLHPNMEIDVREHAFLLGTHTIEYSFVRIKGLANVLHGGDGMYLDRFVTKGDQGLLILHGFGDVFQKTLAAGEKIMIEPGGFLYKDSSVQMDAIKLDDVKTGMFGNMRLAEVTGPGRVGIQSIVRPPPLGVTMTDSATTYYCPYCRTASDPTGASCIACGAAFDVRHTVSNSGWVKQPPIKDMSRLKIGQSRAQISGNYVPVTEVELAPEDWIYFSHHVLLHVDSTVRLANMPMKGAWSRLRAGLPVFMLTAAGPGRIALSYDHPGETIAVPLQVGQVMDITEHRLLAATGSVTYGYENSGVFIETVRSTSDGTEREWNYPMGQFIDRFTAVNTPGLLLLHAPGNVMFRDLAAGEEIVTQPRSLIYKDPAVVTSLHLEYPNGGNMFRNAMHQWLRLVGPGRIAISSVFEQPEPLTGRIASASPYTVQNW